MRIRRAVVADADAACRVLRASITELCAADHHNAPEALAAWLANKTPENVASWIADPDNIILVAEDDGTLCAVGGLSCSGEIALNYVAPAARFAGVSKAMIVALEDEARALGLTEVTLDSTLTAVRFYKAAGFVENGAAGVKHGLPNFPMSKRLL
jgi:GNAT superfamily N-acetyltransferase